MSKKLWAAMAVMMTVGLTGSAASADGSISAGNSNPAVLYVYSAYTPSTIGYWDLTNFTSVPTTATVWAVQESWTMCTACNITASNMRVALFNGQGYGYYLGAQDNGVILDGAFDGEPVQQKWGTYFESFTNPYSNGGYIIPKFWLFWKDGVSGTSGITALEQNGKKETKLLPTGTINPAGFTY